MKNFKSVFQLVFIVLLVSVSSSTYASTITAFGPKQYVRTTGAPNIYTDTFRAEPGEALLVIRNGEAVEEKGKNSRVRSGVISLNGTVLFSHDDFKHQTYILETPINFQESNSLRIELESIPGTFISIEIIQEIIDPVIDLLASDLQADSAHCPEYINISLRLTNTGEAELPAGIPVAFYNGNPQEGGTLIGTATSMTPLSPSDNENISFQWFNSSVEEAVLYAQVDDDGTGTGAYEEVDEANNLISVEALLCKMAPPGDSSLSGRVIDAVNGNFLAGVQTFLHADDNGSPGAVVASFETDSEGAFLFSDLAPGSYFISATHSGYIDNQRAVTVGENVQLTNQDLVLSPVLNEDEIRIILTWGERPADLEAHLTAPNQDGCRYHCYYWNKSIPDANLDLDDRNGYGPETITITDKVSGTYRYYVHDFTNRYSNSRWLALSGAEVKVYSGNREPLVFTVPNGYGNVWHVFDLNGETGEVTPVHIMARQPEPGRIDYPTITSGAPRNAYWNSPYSYQVQATDPDNDILTYSLQQTPEGMTIDPDTGLIEWTPSGSQSGWYNVTVKVDDGRCGEVTQSFNVYVNSQPTAQFTVDPCSGMNPGGNITLSWSTTRASTILIDQGIGEVPASGSLTIPSPETPTKFNLTAFNDAALIKRSVPTAPYTYFYFSPNRIYLGESTTLYWDPRCATSASIDHNVGEVTSSGSIVLTPSETTSYNLTVTNAARTRDYRATVYLVEPPAPSPPGGSISITPNCNLTPGEPLTLSWRTNNATSISIAPDIGDVESIGSLTVYHTEPGSYRLTATGEGGSITRTVSYPNYPSLSFYVSPSYGLDLGDSVTLHWSAGCADTVTMNQGIGEVDAIGSLTVTPESLPITYILTAENEKGPVSRGITLYQIPPRGTFTATPAILKVGDSSTLTWSSTRATSCSITPDIGSVDLNGSMTITPTKPTSYTLTMVGPGGTYRRAIYVGFVYPMADLKASSPTINEGESVQLSWVFANATSCVIDQGIGEVELGGEVTVTPAITTTYTMTATGPGGTATDRLTINVIPADPPPTVSLSTNDNFIIRGGSAVLNWESKYTDSLIIEPYIGTVAATGTRTVSPEVTTTYTATATGPDGTATAKVTVTVLQPSPSLTLQAEPISIMAGESALLSWTSRDVDRIIFNQGIGNVALQGSLTVSPNTTTTYTATATGPGGTTTRSVTVTVRYPVPTINLSVDKDTLMNGESAVLTWTSSHVESVSIAPGIGVVAATGSITVSPTETTTYTITATGPGGSAVSSKTVTVISNPAPTVSITTASDTIQAGESVMLSWVATDADSVSIDHGVGSVTANGSVEVYPAETTTYTISASNSDHPIPVTESITVTVMWPQPTVSFHADTLDVSMGGSVVLTWETTDAQAVRIEPDIGTVAVTGSMEVKPTKTTIFTITAMNPVGTISDNLRIFVTSPTGYFYGNPTPAEQAVLEAINRARLNPSGEADRLGIDLNEGLADGTISAKAVQPLTFNACLHQAAGLHAQDMIDQQYYGHDSQDGRAFWDRILAVGYQYDTVGENIAYTAAGSPLSELDTLLFFQDALFLDNGVEGKGHRLNILSSPFKEVGLASAYGSYGEDPYCYKFTCDFGSPSSQTSSFLLGVVYDDKNSNGIYEAGEGVENVNIQIVESGEETISASAGGYGIPLSPGYYTIKAFLSDGRESIKEFNITDQNVKVDFLVSDFSHPQPNVGITSTHQNIQGGDIATLTWSSMNAETCIIEPDIGNVDVSGSITVSPAEMTTYTITASGLGGTAVDDVTVCVHDQSNQISADLSVSPKIIGSGEFTTLTWTTSGADSCRIEPSIGIVELNGSMTISPSATTEYTIIASGVGGTAQGNVTVNVAQPFSTINGSVTNSATGDPIPGVTISADDGVQVHSIQTDSSGEFEMRTITPGEITLTFKMAGFTPLETIFNLEGGQTKTVHINLNENPPESTEVTATGTVQDAQTGALLDGAHVSITDSDKTQSTFTRNDGSYSVSGVLPGFVEITVNHAGYLPETRQSNYDTPGIWQGNFELYREAALVTVQGTIINSATLQPEEGVAVIAEGMDISDVTDMDGAFSLNNVPMGELTLHILKADFNDTRVTMQVDADPYSLDFVFPYTDGLTYPEKIDNNIVGIINDGITGQPLAGAIVKVIGTSIEETTDQDGEFSLTGLPDGNIQITAMAVNHEAVAVYPTVVPGASDTFIFHLSPTTRGTVTGTVTDAETGEPILNARLGIGVGALVGAQTEADGTFNMLGVPSGSYTVTAGHPAYMKDEKSSIIVQDDVSSTVDFVLTPRSETGSLEGIITDKESGEPISGAVLEEEVTGISGSTDINGYYLLNDLPAGLVSFIINAEGYPDTIRATAVDAETDNDTPAVATFDIILDPIDPSPPDSASALVIAAEGGSIESPDKRFMMVIPPGALSGDAIVTLMSPTTGPDVNPGDILNLDPVLGENEVVSLGQLIQIAVEPSVKGAEVPTINGWVVLAGRYFQSTIDALNLDESTVFPYYWDGTNWTVMQIKPYEFAVDEINNRHIVAVNFSVTESGDPIAVDLSMKKPVLLASLDDYIPDFAVARLYTFIQAASMLIDLIDMPPNAYIYDKDGLDILNNIKSEQIPNDNALPLLIVHGWTPMATLLNQNHTDPNSNKTYKYIVDDLVTATNGVYRPMFGTYNSRSGIVDSGNSLANAFEALNVKGNPGASARATGEFPYFDTFGFSMGGLVSRTLQAKNQGVHNMVIAATPNHGTHFLLKKLEKTPFVSLWKTILNLWSPGTMDLYPYDDSALSAWSSGNPTLYNLNRSSSCMPQANMALIAGTDGVLDPLLDLLLGHNDKVVPVDSVFCRTTATDDDNKSLLKVNFWAEKKESLAEFDHLKFGSQKYRIKDHSEVYKPIQEGLSDWLVGTNINSYFTTYDDKLTIEYTESEVEVQYNVPKGEHDRVVLVIYGQDGNEQWHIGGTHVDEFGNVKFAETIYKNSKDRDEPLLLHTNMLFKREAGIRLVVTELVSLKPGQTTVPFEPSANFSMPSKE